MSAQLLNEPAAEVDLSVTQSTYFGRRLDSFDNIDDWPFRPGDGDLMRHTYVFQALYRIGSGDNATYGGIQLRSRVSTYGDIPQDLRQRLEWTAHRAAYIFDTSIEVPGYSTYLTGFNVFETFKNWEHERVTGYAVNDPGVVDWSVEVYVDDSFDEASLSGIAQGISNPYGVSTRHVSGQPEISIPPHKWTVAGPHESRPDYYELRPPAHSDARDRYRDGAGRGKRVYINGRYVGETDQKGRVWLKIEYAAGDGHSHGSKYSRKGVVEETGATYQAIRDGGTLYLTGESEERIDLVTAREKPDDYRAADPDDVPVYQRVQDGRVGRTEYHLGLLPRDAEMTINGRRDDVIIRHMGRSRPSYTHELSSAQEWRPSPAGGAL